MLLTWGSIAPAYGQEDSGNTTVSAQSEPFADIIVTARRKAEASQTVPIAITALGGRELEARGITKLADIGRSVPGVVTFPATVRGSNTPVFMIRGIMNRDPALTNDASIGLYFAEVPWARADGANAALIDLESVEVLKGPQGTLFGRNSTAGAILVTPKAPSQELEGYAKLSAGNYDLLGAEAVINAPLGDTLAIRLAGSHEQRSGFARNVTSGRRTNNADSYSARASLKWEPTDFFSTTFIGTYFESDVAPDGSKLIAIPPAAPSAFVSSLYTRLVDALARTKALGKYEFLSSMSPSVFAQKINGVPSVLTGDPYSRVKTKSIQNSTTIDIGSAGILGDLVLKNIVSYRKVENAYTSEAIPVDFLNVSNAATLSVRQFTEELQVQGSKTNFDYIIGAFYFRESGKEGNLAYSLSPISSLTDNNIVNTSYSFFFNGNYSLSSLGLNGLSISGGVRFNNDRRYIDNRNRRQTTPGQVASPQYTCLLQPAIPVNDGSLCSFRTSRVFSEPTWNIGLNYKTAGSLLYATVSHGYRTGGFNAFATSLPVTVPFNPEFVDNFELGAKNDFEFSGLKVRWNFAGYYIKYSDIQRSLNVLTGANTLSQITVNAARAHTWGGESELVIRPTANLELLASYSYSRPKYDQFTDNFREPSSGVIYPIDISDSEFTSVSKHMVNVGARYTIPVAGDKGEIALSGNYYYRSSFYNGADINTAQCTVPGNPNPAAVYTNCYNRASRLPGYGLFNARMEWRDTMGLGIDTALFVSNLTNKFYYSNAISTLGTLGGLAASFGQPRMFGGSVTVHFGGHRN
ncbi:iron complex outermembrane receptor protein [Novosphingobium hassiacum]|uniref:Iron complex outermembrane receptor protein n=1 Tax=Novosphingobium hassiacum TaxID=173676 RepID=A0A7W6EUL6_9SPHN|nr:TonB-dependent receptor [Novosphingobium hassiacum]MBB3859322.1 iron complex outermembrane receptor protein [Novosphingobium hassiacum]